MDFDFDDDELSAYLDQEMDGNTHTNNKNNHLNSVIMPMKKKNEKNYYTMKNDNSQRNDNGSNHQIIGNSQYRSNSLKQKVRVDTTKASTSKPPVLVNNKFIAPNSIIKRKKKSSSSIILEQEQDAKTRRRKDENDRFQSTISSRRKHNRNNNTNSSSNSNNANISVARGSQDILKGLLSKNSYNKYNNNGRESYSSGKRKNVNFQNSPSTKSSSSSTSSSNSDTSYYRSKPKRRKAIPGPVGIFKASLNKTAKKALRRKEMVVSRIAATQDSIFDMSGPDKIIDKYSDFRQGPWLKFCYDHMVRPPMAPISYMPPRTTRRDPSKYTDFATIKKSNLKGKVAFTAGIIESFKENFESGKVILKDPSGIMKGSLGGDAVNEYAMKLTPGTILVLQDIAIFTPTPNTFYFNITLKNILRVIPAGTKIPPQMKEVSTILPPSQDIGITSLNNNNLGRDDDDDKLLIDLSPVCDDDNDHEHRRKQISNLRNNQLSSTSKSKKNNNHAKSMMMMMPPSKSMMHSYRNRSNGSGSNENLNENKTNQQKNGSYASSSFSKQEIVPKTSNNNVTTTIINNTAKPIQTDIANPSNNKKQVSTLISKENLDELCAGVDFDYDDAFADENFL